MTELDFSVVLEPAEADPQVYAPLIDCSNGEAGECQSVCTGCGAVLDAPHLWRECVARLEADQEGYLAELHALRRTDEQIEERLGRAIARATGSLAIKMTRMEIAARAANERAQELNTDFDKICFERDREAFRADLFGSRIKLAAALLEAWLAAMRDHLPKVLFGMLGRAQQVLHAEPPSDAELDALADMAEAIGIPPGEDVNAPLAADRAIVVDQFKSELEIATRFLPPHPHADEPS